MYFNDTHILFICAQNSYFMDGYCSYIYIWIYYDVLWWIRFKIFPFSTRCNYIRFLSNHVLYIYINNKITLIGAKRRWYMPSVVFVFFPNILHQPRYNFDAKRNGVILCFVLVLNGSNEYYYHRHPTTMLFT